MSSPKTKGGDYDLGSIALPILDLFSEILILLVKSAAIASVWTLNQILRREGKSVEKVERDSLKSLKITQNLESLGYSVSNKGIVYFKDINRSKHSAIVGASGFGKTNLIESLIFDDLKKSKPVIYIDPKGDVNSLKRFESMCKISGMKFKIFSSYYEYGSKLALVRDGTPTEICDRIHYSFDWSEEHYETLCYRALKRAVTRLKGSKISFHLIKQELLEISGNSKSDEFKRKDIEGLLFRLENISDSYFGEFLDPIGSSMSDIWNNGESIYISLPVLSSPKISRSLGKIILGDLAYAVSEKYKREHLNPGPIGVYIDELGAVITREFIELLNKCRGVGMELTFAFQSPSDIEDISENLCQQILENASNWFIFKQRMEKGANLFSKAIGTVEGRKSTVQVKSGEELDQGSQRVVEENLVHSNIIKNLNPGQCILLRHDPVQIDLVNVRFLDQKRIDQEIQFLKEIGELKKNHTITKPKATTKEVSLV